MQQAKSIIFNNLTVMETTLEKTNKIMNLDNRKGKWTFLILNILLSIGIITIVLPLLYLLFNLEQSDRIFLKCLPIILSGLVFVMFYVVVYHKLTARKHKDRPFKMPFMEKFKVK